MSNHDLKILIVDDHDVAGVGFRQTPCENRRFLVAGEARTAAEALECLRKESFDAVLLDLSLPDGSDLTHYAVKNGLIQ